MCGGNCRSGCGRAGERGFYGNNGYNGYARAGLYQPFVFPNTPSRPSNPTVMVEGFTIRVITTTPSSMMLRCKALA